MTGDKQNIRQDKYGINIKRWMDDHEQYVLKRTEANDDLQELLKWHTQKLKWLQHERLVHFIVTFLTGLGLLFMIAVTFFPEFQPGAGLIMLLFLALFAAYIRHYFILENRVQHWYRMAEELHDRIRNGTTDES